MNPTQTLLGHCKSCFQVSDTASSQRLMSLCLIAHNGLFRIDPRVDGNKLVESQYKQYASKNDFSAAVTTESGKIAVASNKGDIRLFDAVGKNAKVSLAFLHTVIPADLLSGQPTDCSSGTGRSDSRRGRYS